MKIRNIFIALLFMSAAAFGQFQQVSVMDIQFLPDSIISQGDAPSPLNGDTVIVQGVCVVAPLVDQQTDRRPIIWAGSRWVSYIQDESGQVGVALILFRMIPLGIISLHIFRMSIQQMLFS